MKSRGVPRPPTKGGSKGKRVVENPLSHSLICGILVTKDHKDDATAPTPPKGDRHGHERVTEGNSYSPNDLENRGKAPTPPLGVGTKPRQARPKEEQEASPTPAQPCRYIPEMGAGPLGPAPTNGTTPPFWRGRRLLREHFVSRNQQWPTPSSLLSKKQAWRGPP